MTIDLHQGFDVAAEELPEDSAIVRRGQIRVVQGLPYVDCLGQSEPDSDGTRTSCCVDGRSCREDRQGVNRTKIEIEAHGSDGRQGC